METSTEPRVTMLYDGSCPLCSREVNHYKKIDRHDQVMWVDIATDQAILKQHDVTFDAAMRHLHAVTVDGEIVRGAFAFAEVWRQLPYYRYLAKLVALPGVLPVLDYLYRHFASWRYARRLRCNRCDGA